MIAAAVAYEFPQAAYLLFGSALLLCLFWILFQYRKKRLDQFAPISIASKILIPRSPWIFWSKAIALALAWILAVLALMQPKGNAHYPAAELARKQEPVGGLRRNAHEIIFLIDASASMSVSDSRNGKPRLEYAKEIAEELMSRLTGETGALYAFTSAVAKLSPLTSDYLFLRLMLREIQINEGDVAGTDLLEALSAMRKQYFNTPSPVLKTLILFSDGGDNYLETLQGQARGQAMQALVDQVSNAQEESLRVFTIGMGTKKGQVIPGMLYEGHPVKSALDEELLQKISKEGRGNYYFANALSAPELAEDLLSQLQKDPAYFPEKELYASPVKASENVVYDLYFQLPLGFAIVLFALALMWPDSHSLRPIGWRN